MSPLVEPPDELPVDARSDAALVAASNDGDAAAFEAIYRRHRDWVVNLAFRFLGDRDLALDVCQKTFLNLLKKFPGSHLTPQMRPFLYPAVRNLSIPARRKSQRYQSSESELDLLDTTPAAETTRTDPGELAAVLDSL